MSGRRRAAAALLAFALSLRSVMTALPPILVTGAGLVVSCGLSAKDAWEAIRAGRPGIGPLERFDVGDAPCRAAAEIPIFSNADILRQPKNEKLMGTPVRLALRAALAAVDQSGVDLKAIDPYRIAVHTGSGETGLESAELFRALALARAESGPGDYAKLGGRASRLIDPYFSLRTLANAGTGFLCTELVARGPSSNYVQGDTASIQALANAWRDLAEDRCDVAVVGGFDSLLTPSTYLAYHEAGLLSQSSPDRASRPFDRDRDGIVLGEGAGFVVLERPESVARRDATVLGVLEGCGLATDPGPWLEAKRSETVLRQAIARAGDIDAVDVVVAHGVSTRADDEREAHLLEAVFSSSQVPVTAFKGHTGYLGAATGVVELVLAIHMLGDLSIPPIAKLDVPDPVVNVDFVRGSARQLHGGAPRALCLAWAWTGACSAVVVSSRGRA